MWRSSHSLVTRPGCALGCRLSSSVVVGHEGGFSRRLWHVAPPRSPSRCHRGPSVPLQESGHLRGAIVDLRAWLSLPHILQTRTWAILRGQGDLWSCGPLQGSRPQGSQGHPSEEPPPVKDPPDCDLTCAGQLPFCDGGGCFPSFTSPVSAEVLPSARPCSKQTQGAHTQRSQVPPSRSFKSSRAWENES